MSFIFETFALNKQEYAKIYSEINTNYQKYWGKSFAIHMSYGVDDKAYAYYFENQGYNQYNIYMKTEI